MDVYTLKIFDGSSVTVYVVDGSGKCRSPIR
jgi:hypothetical protein